jgi:hypothetical protein
MNDVLGSALQKLASAEPHFPPPLSPSQAEDSVDCGENKSSSIVAGPGTDSLPTESVPTEAEAPSLLKATDSSASQSLKAILLQNPLPFLLAHRRRVAAAVVLICMVAIWSEESTSITPQASEEPTADITSVESLLADFATLDARSMRDPAEPVNPSAHAFQLTIPQASDASQPGSEADSSPHSSSAMADYSNEGARSGFSVDGPFHIPNSASRTTPGSTQDSGSSTGVRFTGRIQPLK